jgi:hypothetical protein
MDCNTEESDAGGSFFRHKSGGFARSDAGERAAVDLRIIERRARDLAQPGSGGSGENVLLLNQIQQDDSFHAKFEPGYGPVAGGRFGAGQRGFAAYAGHLAGHSANNGTMNSSNVKSISNQISGILDEVTTLANTSYQGQYIFAGGQTSTAPFSTSTATSPAVTTYNGDEDINYLQMPNGQRSS